MDNLIEFLLEFVLDLGYEASKSKRIPKYIRYPIIALLLLFYCGIVGFIIIQGFLMLPDDIVAGLIFIGIGILLTCSIWIVVNKTRKKLTEINDQTKTSNG